MSKLNLVLKVLCCAALFTAMLPSAKADEWNKKTKVTFSGPVEIPGTVLEPGQYVFKLVDSQADRHIVQVLNADQSHVYATILAIPNYRMQPTGKTAISFYEMPAGQPQALRAWFYPGDNYGQEFAYPKTQATQISQVTSLNVPVQQEETESQEAQANPPAPVRESGTATQEARAAEPSTTEPAAAPPVENEPAQNQEAQERAPEPPQPVQQEPAERAPQTMPSTASTLPLIAMWGLLSVGAAAALRLFPKRRAS